MNVSEGLSAKNVKSQKVICNFYMFDKRLVKFDTFRIIVTFY